MERTELTDLKGKLDAAEAVLHIVLLNTSVTSDEKDKIKEDVLRWAHQVRIAGPDNPLSIAQAEAMERYASERFSSI